MFFLHFDYWQYCLLGILCHWLKTMRCFFVHWPNRPLGIFATLAGNNEMKFLPTGWVAYYEFPAPPAEQKEMSFCVHWPHLGPGQTGNICLTKHMFLWDFQHIFRRVLGQTETYFSLRKTFDPRRWGFRHLYILHSLTVATRGVKTYVDRCNWPSKSYVWRPKSNVKNAPTSPDIQKRCRSNICFELQKHVFCQLKTYVLGRLTRP